MGVWKEELMGLGHLITTLVLVVTPRHTRLIHASALVIREVCHHDKYHHNKMLVDCWVQLKSWLN